MQAGEHDALMGKQSFQGDVQAKNNKHSKKFKEWGDDPQRPSSLRSGYHANNCADDTGRAFPHRPMRQIDTWPVHKTNEYRFGVRTAERKHDWHLQVRKVQIDEDHVLRNANQKCRRTDDGVYYLFGMR